MPFNPDKLAALVKKGSGGAGSRTGGKGSVRRKHKAVRKNVSHDDKRLKSALSKLNVRDIPAIEEVNLFKDDGTVIHFTGPKVQASIAANTYVVSGNCVTKKLEDLLPNIINQLGPDNLEDLKKIYDAYRDMPGMGKKDAATGDDDDVPDLVNNFEDVLKADDAGGAQVEEAEDDEEDDDEGDDDCPDLVDN